MASKYNDNIDMMYLLHKLKDFLPVMGYELKSFKENKKKQTYHRVSAYLSICSTND